MTIWSTVYKYVHQKHPLKSNFKLLHGALEIAHDCEQEIVLLSMQLYRVASKQ